MPGLPGDDVESQLLSASSQLERKSSLHHESPLAQAQAQRRPDLASVRQLFTARRGTKSIVFLVAVATLVYFNHARFKSTSLERSQPSSHLSPNEQPIHVVAGQKQERPAVRETAPPSWYILDPPDDLARDLSRCAALCSKLPDPHPDDADEVLDSPLLLSYDEQVTKAFGGDLPYADKYPQDLPYALHNTDQFSLPAIVHLRVASLIASLPSPPTLSSADFLLLALDTQLLPRCTSCSHPELLPATLDRHAIRRRAVDWLTTTVASHYSRRQYSSMVLPLSLIDHDYEKSLLMEKAQDAIKDHVVVLGIEREPWETRDKLRDSFEQVPYPSIFSLPVVKGMNEEADDPGGKRAELEQWLLKQERTHLVSFAGKSEPNSPKSGKGPFNGYAIRRLLATTLAGSYANDSRVAMQISNPGTQRATFIPAIHSTMLHSTFCLQPPGDSATRKGFFESVLLGCIPVVFRAATYAKVFRESGIEWSEEVAFVVDGEAFVKGQRDIVEILAAVSPDEVERRRKEIVRVAKRVQYGVPKEGEVEGWGGDAFGMLLKRLESIKARGEDGLEDGF
ncbi:hypothetical protein RQP46_011083 [Phenoliferia psychrophenolica]